MSEDALPPYVKSCLRIVGGIICLAGSILMSLPFYGIILWWLFLPMALIGSGLVWAVNNNYRRSIVFGCLPYCIPVVCQSLYYFFVHH